MRGCQMPPSGTSHRIQSPTMQTDCHSSLGTYCEGGHVGQGVMGLSQGAPKQLPCRLMCLLWTLTVSYATLSPR